MSALSRMQRACVLPLASAALASASLVVAAPAHAQTIPAAPSAGDMDMPDDLGKPLDGVIPVRRPAAVAGVLSLDTPIAEIAADPRGKAVLQKDLPGLCERPEFVMFKGMTLPELSAMSHGKLTAQDLDKVKIDLAAQQIAASAAPRRTHNPILVGGRAVGRVTHAIYKRMVIMVASL